MKKNSALWLLPLAAALFIGVSADLSALSAKDEKQLAKLEETLAKKGKLSNSNQKKYDQLKAEKAAEASLLLAEPSATLEGEPTLAPAASELSAAPPENELIAADEFRAPAQSKPVGAVVASRDPVIPNWVTDPDDLFDDLVEQGVLTRDEETGIVTNLDEYIIGIGTAKDTTPQKSIQMAEARARQDIAIQANSVVRARIRDYAETREDNSKRGNTHSDSSISSVAGSQSTDIVLTNVRVVKRHLDRTDNKTWWVVAIWPKSEIGSTVLEDEEGDYVQRALDEFRALDAPSEPAALKPPAAVPVAPVTESVAVVSE